MSTSRRPNYNGVLRSRRYPLATRHVHDDKPPFIRGERNPFSPGIPPSRNAFVLNFRRLVSIHWREPAPSSRFFPATPAPNPAVSEEIVRESMRVGGSGAWLWNGAVLRDEWPVLLGRDWCEAGIGDDSALVSGEPDALDPNAGCFRMEFCEETESAPARFRSPVGVFSCSVRI